jgi:Protein of unknown function (DUF2911)
MTITRIFFSAILLITAAKLQAQGSRLPPLDKSPLDISYYPANYPVLKIQDKITEPLLARVIYSRPSKAGRNIIGDLVEYGQIWRMGANEATEIELFRDVTVMSNKVKKGRYTLFAIPGQEHWTIIFNRETDTWGAFRYDMKKDALRVDLKPERMKEEQEVLSMYFEKNGQQIDLNLLWDNIKLSIPFTVDPTVKKG